MKIVKWIHYESSIDELGQCYPCLHDLNGRAIKRLDATRWVREGTGEESYALQIIFIGKTGYGKSTTLNAIIGRNLFETSDVESCTRRCQAANFRLHLNGKDYLSLGDLPGIGESRVRDAEYLEEYRRFLGVSAVVVYLLRVDQRDFSVDEEAFRRLFVDQAERDKVVIGLNAADKIEPLRRDNTPVPSHLQRANIDRKRCLVAALFRIPVDRVVPYSARSGWNLDILVKAVSHRLHAAKLLEEHNR